MAASWPRAAAAHIDLLEPSPRAPGRSADPNANLKEAPCGQVENGRTENVHVFAPGQTISVRWREFVSHRSYYRVAFDPDGDDAFPIFPGPGTSPVGDDPTRTCPVDGRVILAYDLTDGPGGEHSLEVTLPDVECDNCTLQVIQYMYDTGRPYYYQCADLALRAPRSNAEASDAGASDAAAPDAALWDAASPPEFRAADSCSAALPPRPRSDAGARPDLMPSAEAEDTADPSPELATAPTRGTKGGGCSLPAQPAGHDDRTPVAAGALLLALWALRPRVTPPSSRQI